MTKIEDDQNGRRPKLNGRQPKWKMEDDQDGRRPRWKIKQLN